MQGFGTKYYIDGSKYIGEWKDGNKHGEGMWKDKYGKESKGRWENDERIG